MKSHYEKPDGIKTDKPKVYICAEQDTWARIAEKHKPANKTKHEWATYLLEKNKGLVLAEGVEVQL